MGLSFMQFPFLLLQRPWSELAVLMLSPYLFILFVLLRQHRKNDLFRVVSENAADMIALVNVTGERLYNSPAYEKVLGYSPQELAATGSLDQVHPDDRQGILEAANHVRVTGVGKRIEYRMRHKDGNWRVLESTANPIRNRKGQVTQLVIVNRDITERKRIEQQLERGAFYDALTGLPNRTLFLDRLQRAAEHAKRFPDFNFAVLFINVQGLKIFNETMGLAVVDQLIIDISKRLNSCLRHNDTAASAPPLAAPSGPAAGEEFLARMDGERFTVLLEDIKSPSDAMRVAIRLQESLSAPFTANGVDAFTSANIGIALSSPQYCGPAEMLRDADIAVCRAQAKGTSGCEVFDAHMHALVVKRLRVETELRKAIEREDLRVFYQPIIRLASGRISGAEALVRWRRNESEIVAPANFIDVAEETGLIVPLGSWVFREACRQAHAWHQLMPAESPLITTINISPRQFVHGNLVAEIKSALDETKVAPETLQIEITETMLMNDSRTTARILSQLKDLGVRISIDDFGTGHSSLSRLRNFPVDVLKIDRSFIHSMEHDLESREITRLIVTLAHQLNLEVIAEGIEAPGQRACLEQFGCEFGQGYLYSRPVTRGAFENLFTSGGSKWGGSEAMNLRPARAWKHVGQSRMSDRTGISGEEVVSAGMAMAGGRVLYR